MPELPRQIRLAPGDYFMHGQDLRIRKSGMQGNVCCAVIRLGAGVDIARLRNRMATSPMMDWFSRVRINRPFPLFPPVWRADAEAKAVFFEHNDANGSTDMCSLPPLVAERKLHVKTGPGVAFDLVRHADGTSHLYVSWNHTLLDARGLDFLLSHLNSNSESNGAPTLQDFLSPRQTGPREIGWWPNAQLAHRSMKWLTESGKEPLFSLAPQNRPSGPCRNFRRLVSFTDEETGRIDARCQKITAGFRRSHFFLAASIRALHTLAVQRGNKDGAYVTPVPHDTRKFGAKGPIFSNHLSILFYRIEPRQAGNISGIVAEIGRQMADQIRDRFPDCCIAALDMFKVLPLPYYVHHLGKPTRGKIASFSFSDSGEICPGMTELWGGEILDVTHVIPSWRPPGLTVLFLRFKKRLSIMLSWVDDCMNLNELNSYERDLRRALLDEDLS